MTGVLSTRSSAIPRRRSPAAIAPDEYTKTTANERNHPARRILATKISNSNRGTLTVGATINALPTDTPATSMRRRGIADLRLRLALLLTLLFTYSFSAHAENEGLFGFRELPAATLAALPRWQALLERIDRERPAYRQCERDCDTLRGRLWRNYLSRREPTLSRLWELNTFINTFPRRATDRRWSTPLEFLRRGGDDVEMAVMKYVTLRELGVAESRLRLVLGRDVLTDRPHAVLAVELAGEHHILDSRSDTVLTHHAVVYYQPRLSLNAEGRWLHLPPKGERP